MNWAEMLRAEVEDVFHAAEGLIGMIGDDMLDWKPEAGENWMTVGQLLLHVGRACGACMKGFVTGDWSPPEGVEHPEPEEGEMLLPAEKLPAATNVAQAREMLAADKRLALEMIERAGEENLATKEVGAPWNPTETFPLGLHLLHMINRLAQHKGQLFYYLKLKGRPVHTGTLWGM
jgi:uncharacterized damage-inducible protein DinB